MPAAVPPEAERLYGLPLDEFVPARNSLAKELRGAGRREEAELVQRLRRPPPALWAVNQLARARPDDVATLVRVAERVRGGDLESADEVSRAVERLVGGARELLEGAGHAAGDAALQRVAATLRAAAADPDYATALEAGRLTDEVEPAGFDAMAALAGATRRTAPAATAAEPREGARLRRAREEMQRAAQQARELGRAADAAEREAERSRAEADRAEAELERARDELERLEGRKRR